MTILPNLGYYDNVHGLSAAKTLQACQVNEGIMETTVRLLSQNDETAFIHAMKTSQAFHYPWIDAPKDGHTFGALLKKSEMEDNFSYLVIHDQCIAGVINLNQIIRGVFQNAFLGFYAVKKYAGQGIMTNGLRQVIKRAFNQHGLHRLEANIQPSNMRSISLVQRCGFCKEGYSKKYLKIFDQWQDHERWAILKEDVGSISKEEKTLTAGVAVVHELNEKYLLELMVLYQGEWWCRDRTLDDARLIVSNSTLVFGLIDQADDRLIGFARVLTDTCRLAHIYDVIIHPKHRQQGLSKKLMDYILTHPLIKNVKYVDLVCKKDMRNFYHQFDFSDHFGDTLAMRKRND